MINLNNYAIELLKIIKEQETNIVPKSLKGFLNQTSNPNGIIILQDPYAFTCSESGKPQALSIPVASNCRIPPYTLRILKSLISKAYNEEETNSLSVLRSKGVFLCNVAWTTSLYTPKAHLKGYINSSKSFIYTYHEATLQLISWLLRKTESKNIPVFAAGAYAQDLVRDKRLLTYKTTDGELIHLNNKLYVTKHPAATKYGAKFNAETFINFLKHVQRIYREL